MEHPMEELPTDVKIVVVEEKNKTKELLERIEKFLDLSPTLELLSVVRDSLVDIKNILEVQSQKLEKIDALERLKELQSHSESITLLVSRLETAINNFRAKTLAIENATKAMEDKSTNLNEIARRVDSLSAGIEQRNSSLSALMGATAKLSESLEEKTSGLGSLIESYSLSREELERSSSSLAAMHESLRELRNDVFERNQYLNIILSDLTISKDVMEKNIKLLESSSSQLKETAEEMDKKTDDILNVTTRKVEELSKLRDMIYDDIAMVDERVKKVQKAVEKQKKDSAKRAKKQTELLNLVKRINTRVNKIDRQMRKKK